MARRLPKHLDRELVRSTGWKWSTTIVAFGNNPSVRNAAAYTAAGSIATYSTASRNCGVRACSHSITAALVRPVRCPSSPCSPSRSTNPVSHGSTRTHPLSPPRYSHLGLPRRVSSIPSTRTGSGSASRASACSMKARCAVGHDTRCAAATSDTDRAASPIADPIWARNRRVVRARGGTCAMASVNEDRSQ